MPDDTITLVSTTDSAEEVQAALTNKPVEKPAAEKTGEAGEANQAKQVPPETPPEETPEQVAERESKEEASEAGSALAKRRAKIQAQIDKDIQRKTAARLDAEAEESRLTELRRQRQELETTAAPAKDETPAAPDGPLGRPEPQLDAVDDQGNAKYATYENYLSDHAVWTKEEAILATRKLIDEKDQADRVRIERDSTNRVVNERLAAYNAELETFKKTHADFDALVTDAKEVIQEAFVGLGPNAMRVIDGYTVFDAQDGPALTYHFLKHPDELKEIALKPPPQQLVALARLEERIRPAGAKKNGPSAAVAETKAPEPIRPVGSGPTATTVSPDDESYQDYKARRARELRARQGI